MDDGDAPQVSRRRIAIYYTLLIAAVAAAAAFALARGSSEQTEPVIAGGYDVVQDANCLGPAINLVQSGRFDPTPLLTHRFRLAEITEAYRIFSNRVDGVLKVVITP